MEDDGSLTRRRFIQSAGTLTGAAYLRLTGATLVALAESACTARDKSAAFRVLTNDEAATIKAIAARIIPTTDTPGADEAGVIYFFDNVLGDLMRDKLDSVRNGIVGFHAALTSAGESKVFAELAPDRQDEILASGEGTEFFELVRELTIMGFFSMETYGGNRDHVGWKLIGFKGHQGAWTYPFGHYDAAVNTGKAGDE